MDFSDDSYCDDESTYDEESTEQTGSPDFDEKSDHIEDSKNYKVLTRDDIQQNQEQDVTLLSTTLAVPRIVAAILLRNFKWSVENAQEAWFSDEDKVRDEVGLPKKLGAGSCKRKRVDGDSLVCNICFEVYEFNADFESTVGFCGHSFCGECLETYVSVAISDGPGCLFLRCPDPDCRAVIGEDMVNLLASDDDKRKYNEFLLRSYVELSNRVKWCPAPDCECAIECEVGSESYDVTCLCSRGFCWDCFEDSHQPVDCEAVREWMMKNKAESNNVSWIIAYTKPCPKCKVPIQKNNGCMIMTCRPPCGYVFCWICLESIGQHRGGGCNGYKATASKKNSEEVERERAKEYLVRYVHYYERWAANHKSREQALVDLNNIKTKKLEQLEQKHCQTAVQLKFITEAWEQIIECRRVLKWSYVYGYFLPREETKKIKLFEFLQGEAEVALERLHHCTENKLSQYISGDATSDEFNREFRKELTNLTRVTGNYFANFLKGLQNSLAEAECGVWQCDICTYLNQGDQATCSMCQSAWECKHCTYLNKAEHETCFSCDTAR